VRDKGAPPPTMSQDFIIVSRDIIECWRFLYTASARHFARVLKNIPETALSNIN
jgi:hypothetical protein